MLQAFLKQRSSSDDNIPPIMQQDTFITFSELDDLASRMQTTLRPFIAKRIIFLLDGTSPFEIAIIIACSDLPLELILMANSYSIAASTAMMYALAADALLLTECGTITLIAENVRHPPVDAVFEPAI